MQISKNLLIGIFFILCSTAFAQNQSSVKGNITDHNGEALAGVSVKFKNSGLSTASDHLGNYQLENVSNGKDILIFSGIGTKTAERTIYVSGNAQVVNIKLMSARKHFVINILKSSSSTKTRFKPTLYLL